MIRYTERRCQRCDLWAHMVNDDVICGACIALVGMLPGTLRRRYRDAADAGQWSECTRIAAELDRRGLPLVEAA